MLDAAGAVPRQREAAIGMALVDGQIVASMKRATTASRVTFTLRPHAAWRPAMRPVVDEAAQRYADFLGLDPIVIRP